jgi:hypothetical protein
MKNFGLILFFFMLGFPVGGVFASTTSINLVTYYPAPTLNANKLQLPASGGNCGSLAEGTLFLDTTGTLKLCHAGVAMSYPQQCYNSFCTDSTGTCVPACNGAAGYSAVRNLDTSLVEDFMQTDATHYTGSIACCGGN